MRSHDATRQWTRRRRTWAWEGDEGEQQPCAVCVCFGVIQRAELRATDWDETLRLCTLVLRGSHLQQDEVTSAQTDTQHPPQTLRGAMRTVLRTIVGVDGLTSGEVKCSSQVHTARVKRPTLPILLALDLT